jgi:cell division protein ZapA
MGEVTINVNGRPYRMACEDGQEGHLNTLGEDLAQRVEDLSSQVGKIGDATLLVMAALLISDEHSELKESVGDQADGAALKAERDALAKELADLRTDAATMAQERDAALARAATAEAQAAEGAGSAEAEAAAAQSIEALATRVSQLASVIRPA